MFANLLIVILSLYFLAVASGAAAPSPNQYYYCAYSDPTGQNVFTSQGSGSANGYSYVSSDYGATWTKLVNSPTGGAWKSCAASNDLQKLFIADSNLAGKFYKSTDGGASWTTVNTLNGLYYWTSLSTDRATATYVLAASWQKSKLWYSSDSGNSWTLNPLTDKFSYTASSTDGSHMYVSIYGGTKGSYYSTDHGVTWTASDLPGNKQYQMMACSGDGSLVVTSIWQTNSKLYASSDFGHTFTTLAASTAAQTYWGIAVSATPVGGKYTIVANDINTQKTYYSTDSGATFGVSGQNIPTVHWTTLSADGTYGIQGTQTYIWYGQSNGANWCQSSTNAGTCPYTFGAAAPPTAAPSLAPGETDSPTMAPTTAAPIISFAPTFAPTEYPTESPTESPTEAPSEAPSFVPTAAPSEAPTFAPTIDMNSMSSGYYVGMSTRHVIPVITIIPFCIVIIALILLCCFCGGGAEVSLGWTGFYMGLVAMGLSCVQFGLMAAAYSQTEGPYIGSWWIGISCFFAVLFALFAKNRTFASFTSALLIAAFLIGIICTVGDGLYYSHVLRAMESCTNKDGHTWNKTPSYAPESQQCHEQEPDRDLACIHRNHDRCFYFDGITSGNFFYKQYTWLFETGFVFDILLMVSFTIFMLWQMGHLALGKFANYQSPESAAPNQAETTEKEVQLQVANEGQV